MNQQPPDNAPPNQPTGEPQPSAGGPADSPAPAGGQPTRDECNLGVLIHILGFLTSFVGPLIIWLIKKDESKYVDHHGKQALNFQIMIALAYVVGSFTMVVFIGCLIFPAAFVVSVVFSIMAAMAASKGEWYRYPLSLPLIK